MKQNIIFLDFETVTNSEPPVVELPEAPTAKDVKVGNLKDETKIKEKIKESLPKLIAEYKEECNKIMAKATESWKKEALDPLKCKIISCAIALNNEEPEVLTGKEEEIMRKIDEYISKTKGYFVIVAHNAYGFEAPILVLRAFKYKLECRQHFSRRDAVRSLFYDTLDKAKVTDFKAYHSMDSLCEFFGIQTPKEEFNGSMVHDAYFNGEMDKIIKYGFTEIKALRELYNIFEY